MPHHFQYVASGRYVRAVASNVHYSAMMTTGDGTASEEGQAVFNVSRGDFTCLPGYGGGGCEAPFGFFSNGVVHLRYRIPT